MKAVAICFMNSFANPAHEQRAAEIVREMLPDAFLSVSAEILPAIRFYDRVSTTRSTPTSARCSNSTWAPTWACSRSSRRSTTRACS